MPWELKLPPKTTSTRPNAPGTPPPPLETEGFLPRLGGNISEEFGRGTELAKRGKLLGTGGETVLNIPMGVLQAGMSPVTGLARTLGEETLGATGSPAAATGVDLLTQFGVPAAGSGALRAGLRRLPGAPTALREAGREAVEAIPGQMLAGRGASSQAFSVLDEMNPSIGELPRLRAMADNLAKKESLLADFGTESKSLVSTARKTAERLSPVIKGKGKKAVTTPPEPLDFRTAQALRARLGQRINSLRRATTPGAGEELGAMKQMARALSDDLEQAADQGVGSAYDLLRQANRQFRREAAVGEIDDLVRNSVKSLEGKDFEEIRFGALRDKLLKLRRSDERFAGSFEPGELDEIDRLLNELRKVPTTGAAKGVDAGSKRTLRSLAGGAALGKFLGTDPILTAAAVDLSGAAVSKVISSALTNPTGRKLLFAMLTGKGSGRLTRESLALLSAAVRASSEAQP